MPHQHQSGSTRKTPNNDTGLTVSLARDTGEVYESQRLRYTVFAEEAGAYVCGAPAWDPDFNTADLLMLLPMSRLPPRYARHFFGQE